MAAGRAFLTLIMFSPLMAIPLFAVFGIPEFSVINGPPAGGVHPAAPETIEPLRPDEPPVGHAHALSRDEPQPGLREMSATSRTADDLFAPCEQSAAVVDMTGGGAADRSGPSRRAGGAVPGTSPQPRTIPPNEGIRGWALDGERRSQPTQEHTPAVKERRADEKQSPFADRRSTPSPEIGSGPFSGVDERGGETTASQQRPDSGNNDNSPDSPAGAAGAEPELIWKTADARLAELGMSEYALQPGSRPGAFLFGGNVRTSENPRVSRRFEAEAADPLAAVRDVIEQLEAWRERRRQ